MHLVQYTNTPSQEALLVLYWKTGCCEEANFVSYVLNREVSKYLFSSHSLDHRISGFAFKLMGKYC